MKIDRIDELALDAATEAEIGALLDASFDGGFEGRSYYLCRHHLRLVMRDEGRIIGHLALGLRTIRLDERLIDAVTVAEVATAAARRGEGIAAAMLDEAIVVARDTGADFVLLYGVAKFYAAAGFRPVANRTRRVEMEGRRTREVIDGPAGDLMVLPLGPVTWDETAPVDLLGAKF